MRSTLRQTRAVGLVCFSIFAMALAGCSGGSPTSGDAEGPLVANPIPSPAASLAPAVSYTAAPIDCSGCWPTYAHDYERSGFQPQQTGITKSNVANLTPLWSQSLLEQITVSPVIDDGMLFIATGAGNVYAFNESTGAIVWKRNLGAPVIETPTIDHGRLYVGTHKAPSAFFALDVESGNTVWQISISGDFRGPAAVSNGVVYVGEAGGDPPFCDQGGLHAYQAATGLQLFYWKTDPKPNDGGAVWSPVSIDGPNIVFGTGNTCSNNVANANSLIRLTTSGSQEWEEPNGSTSADDDDWGGGVLVSEGRYYAGNKNGTFYATIPETGAVAWKASLSPFDGQGPIGTPTTDGTVIITPSGNLQNGDTTDPPAANFTGFSIGGSTLWTYPFVSMQRNYAPIAGGIAYLAANDQIVAVDAHTGVKLWSYTSGGDVEFTGAPAITPVGLFTADTDGTIIVFAPASSANAAANSRIQVKHGPLYEPYGPIVRKLQNGTSVTVY